MGCHVDVGAIPVFIPFLGLRLTWQLHCVHCTVYRFVRERPTQQKTASLWKHQMSVTFQGIESSKNPLRYHKILWFWHWSKVWNLILDSIASHRKNILFCSRLWVEAWREHLASAKKPFLYSGPKCCCSWTKNLISIWFFTWHASKWDISLTIAKLPVICEYLGLAKYAIVHKPQEKRRDHLLTEVRFALNGRNTGDIRPS